MVERKSFGNQTGTESNGSILINLPNVGLTRIYCAQCHHNSNTGSIGNLVFTNADFNSIHQKSTTEIQQFGYRLPLTPQEILSLRNFLETKNIKPSTP